MGKGYWNGAQAAHRRVMMKAAGYSDEASRYPDKASGYSDEVSKYSDNVNVSRKKKSDVLVSENACVNVFARSEEKDNVGDYNKSECFLLVRDNKKNNFLKEEWK